MTTTMIRPISPINELSAGNVAVLGVPFDAYSSFLRGAALAPARIRKALFSASSNLCSENGLDLGESDAWRDVGDLVLTDDDDALTEIHRTVGELLARQARVIALGGDHFMTWPILRAYAKRYPELSVLHLDAHPDLYDELDGNRFSHACPFARIMEERLTTRLVQVGIRTMTPHQRAQIERFGVEVIEMRHIDAARAIAFEGPVYLSIDMDCLDPAFAPGVSHSEPGGMTTRQVLDVIQNFKGDLVGADIVEFNPERDPDGPTAMVAAKFLKEILGRMLANRGI